MTKKTKDSFSKAIFDGVRKIVDVDAKSQRIPSEPIVRASFYQGYLNEAIDIWQKALAEILSDLTACILFGPAALFSLYDFALQDTLDRAPSKRFQYYPPWRYRLRTTINLLESSTDGFFPLPKDVAIVSDTLEKGSKVENYYNRIKSLTESKKDQQGIDSNSLVKLVYDNLQPWIEDGTKFLFEEQDLKNRQLTPKKLYEKLPYLINRLENNIIPNAIENDFDDRTIADFGDIINVSWYYWLSKLDTVITDQGAFNNNAYKERILLNNLSLKAVEYAHLESCYNKECKTVVEE